MGSKSQSTSISSDQRCRMIAEAAYYRAEHNGFASDSIEDWLEAEAEIDRLLMRQDSPRSEVESKHLFQRRLEEQLTEWDEKLEELAAAAKKAGAKLNKEIHGQLETLAQKRLVAQHKLVELRDHGADAWDELREGAEQLLDELRSSIGKVAGRLKHSAKDEGADAPRGK
jgi:Skp family chaperone for outer membrane proteins